MAGVAQLVRAPGCGPGGRGFKTHRSPHIQETQKGNLSGGFIFVNKHVINPGEWFSAAHISVVY
jgi:hypothetical protein